MTPASLNFIAYRGDVFAFAFQFKDTQGNPFDMSNLGAVTMHVFRANKETDPLFAVDLTESESTITGKLTAEQTIQLRPIIAYYEMRSTFLGRDITLVNGSIVTISAPAGEGVTDYISELTINVADLSVELSLGDSATIALQAKADAQIAQAGAELAEANAIIEANRSRDEAIKAKAEADRIIGTVSVVNFGDDWFELVAINPAQLVEETVTLNGVDINLIEIIIP